MVHFNEGDPAAPGVAELEPEEIQAFVWGRPDIVHRAGAQYGAECMLYAANHPGEDIADPMIGMHALIDSVTVDMTSYEMGLPFMEGVKEGVRTRTAEIQEELRRRAENPELHRLHRAIGTLAEFGKRPDVQAELARSQREAYDNLMDGLRAFNEAHARK